MIERDITDKITNVAIMVLAVCMTILAVITTVAFTGLLVAEVVKAFS